jgi:hypothetical protein
MQLLSTPRFQFVLLLTLTAFLCTIKLDNGGIMAFDECFYAQKAKEIVTSGDWLTQRLPGHHAYGTVGAARAVVFDPNGRADDGGGIQGMVLSLLMVHLSILVVTPRFTLDLKHEIRHPGIRKLATKVRMLDLEPNMKVVQFPATKEIAAQHGMQPGFFSYFSIALPWLFYSDHPLFERSAPASLDETRRYMDLGGGVCLTTDDGFRVISEGGTLPYEIMGRAQDKSMVYSICCSRENFFRWRESSETDFSRPPLYDLRQY